MENLKIVSMNIIANVGSARSKYIEAINASKCENFELAEKLCLEADEIFQKGHKIHSELLYNMANGENIDIDLLLLHAEDQLMATEMFRTLSREFIDIYKRI
ncbi:PTS lactose/cellobiose transporter subunit IIA [Gemelliphila palaticanis]|uniref:PTS lactose/cellobiose transporter subunit IIA n=1 Tax=Gemelliphila palaticanis TaxID=81950 RepID=A0ABX2T0U5_9BACL|nr:PTS lactose/cellobiose transporter subunit IIA [Gemella palaticanis]MBF0715094.1 PTS lactose/cellobiose transporter subunit IIA [Gemella palaticanis]NYS47024.1 PTS lactose/cellobiose transporter subunit IIA [Gemella palaticanis]